MIETKSVSFATGASSPERRSRGDMERLIQGRPEAPDPDESDERYRRSCERYAEQLRTANRAAWALHHQHLAELHDRLADEHRRNAASLGAGPVVGGVHR